jgi:hypothetical protein
LSNATEAAASRVELVEDAIFATLKDELQNGHRAAALSSTNVHSDALVDLAPHWAEWDTTYDRDVVVDIKWQRRDSGRIGDDTLPLLELDRVLHSDIDLLSITGAPAPRARNPHPIVWLAMATTPTFTVAVRDTTGFGQLARSLAPIPDPRFRNLGEFIKVWSTRSGVSERNALRAWAEEVIYREYADPAVIEAHKAKGWSPDKNSLGPDDGNDVVAEPLEDLWPEYLRIIDGAKEWIIWQWWREWPALWSVVSPDRTLCTPYKQVPRINDAIINELAMLAFDVDDHAERRVSSRAHLEQLDYYGLPNRPDWDYDGEDERAPKDPGLQRTPRGSLRQDANGLYLVNKSTAGDWTAQQQSGAAVEYLAIGIADGTISAENVLALLGETHGLLQTWRRAGVTEDQIRALFLTGLGYSHKAAGDLLRVSKSTVSDRVRGARRRL